MTKSLIAAAGISLLAFSASARSAILYDSKGFETSAGFTPGGLAGQSVTNAPVWQAATTVGNAGGGSSVTVENTFSQSGTQAVKFTRALTDNDTYYAPVFNIAPTLRYLDVSCGMYMVSGATLDPFFGIFAFNYPASLGYAGIDGTTGQVVYSQAGSGAMISSGKFLPLNTWNMLTLQLDYTAQTETFFVGNVAVATSGFITGAQTGFTDADLTSFATNGVQTGTGTAYFDNYQIYSSTTAVPEPISASLVAIGATSLLSRRRKPTAV